MRREFTGRDMAMIMVAGFGVVVAVNFYMASLAIGGFGGVVVENSYVASQKFNSWLDEAREGRKLGYAAQMARAADGRLMVTTQGVPAAARVSADLRRPLGRPQDMSLQLEQAGAGSYLSAETLPAGRWIARVTIAVGDQRWMDEAEVQ